MFFVPGKAQKRGSLSDSDGNFYFAETLEQHEANIANYLD